MPALIRSSLFFLSVLSLSACVSEVGNGLIVSQPRSVPSFTRVQVGGGIHATVTQGHQSVKVITDENLQVFIESTVSGDTLILRVTKNFVLTPTGDLRAEITNDVLEGLTASGGARVTADATPAADWPLTASGGSTLILSRLDTPQLVLDASGGSIVQAFGVATNVSATGSGGSQVLTDGVSAEHFSLEASGGSIFRIRASKSVQGSASGGSQVSVSGNPLTRAVSTSGGSQVFYANE